MKLFSVVLLSICLGSCVSAPAKRPPVKAPPAVEQEFRLAEANARAGDHKKALGRLKKVLESAPDSELVDDAYLMAGHSHFALGQFAEALSNYQKLFLSDSGRLFSGSPLVNQARIRAAQSQIRLSRPQDALATLSDSSSLRSLSVEQTIEVEKLRYEAFSGLGKNLDALRALADLSEKPTQPSEKERYRALAHEIIDSRLNEEELSRAAASDRMGGFSAAAKFRLANVLLERNESSRARRLLADVAERPAESELQERALVLIRQIDARERVDARTIGVVLPLSGKQASIGQKALRGIQLGLGIYSLEKNSLEKNASNFRLAVIDSEGNADAARRGVERLIHEDNVIAMIGGLLSRTASAEAAKAQEYGLPAIMLSQKVGITQVGESIFRNALTSQMQVQALVDIAMNQLGFRNFAMIYPNDAYGIEYANLFWDEVRARDGEITGAQTYDPKETDFRGHVQRLVGTFYLEDRAEEYRALSRKFYEKNPTRSARQGGPAIEDILPPIVDFDAIFIPDNARAVGQIAPMLAYNNVNKVRLLGTNLWNSPGLVQRGQRFVENSVFVDSVLATDPRFRNSEFYSSFRTLFGEEAGLIELQAYDSALILRSLVAKGETTRVGLQNQMRQLRDFPGAIGRLSVNADREFRRPLTTLTVRNGAITPLDSAPD